MFGGADGKNDGFGGSVNANGLLRIFNASELKGQRLVDIGIGTGLVAASAIAYGADSAYGHDLPANYTQAEIFDAVLDRMSKLRPDIKNLRDKGAWYGNDILMVCTC
jgi:predicted RNA methylase